MARKSDNIDYRMLGDEPTPKHYTGTELTRALSWYTYYSEKTDVKWVHEYIKTSGYSKKDIASFKKISNDKIPQSVKAISRILNNGGTVDDDTYERHLLKIKALIDEGKNIKEEKKVETPTKSPQDYLNEKIDEVISNVEFEIDSQVTDFPDSKFSLYDHLTSIGAKSIYGKKIVEYYKPILDEINQAINKNDKELHETYIKSFGGIRNLKKHQRFLESIVDDAKRFALNQKKTKVRKRKVKAKSAIDLVKKVNYKKEDRDLKLVSTNPANLVGASSVWTFNTKTRHLTVYHASDGGKLSIKGSTLKNFDEKKSISKKVRVTYLDDILPQVLNGGKIQLRKLMDGINAKPSTPNGRLNKDTLLMRAVR